SPPSRRRPSTSSCLDHRPLDPPSGARPDNRGSHPDAVRAASATILASGSEQLVPCGVGDDHGTQVATVWESMVRTSSLLVAGLLAAAASGCLGEETWEAESFGRD